MLVRPSSRTADQAPPDRDVIDDVTEECAHGTGNAVHWASTCSWCGPRWLVDAGSSLLHRGTSPTYSSRHAALPQKTSKSLLRVSKSAFLLRQNVTVRRAPIQQLIRIPCRTDLNGKKSGGSDAAGCKWTTAASSKTNTAIFANVAFICHRNWIRQFSNWRSFL